MWMTYALLAFLSALAAHAIVSRRWPGGNRVMQFLAVGGLAGLGLLAQLARYYGTLALQTAAGALSYAFLCELYLFLFTLALSSVSANLLARLGGGELTDGEIAALYDSEQMVRNRIERLVATGLLVASTPVLKVSVRGERLLAALGMMRRLFGHDAAARGKAGADR